MEISEYVLRDVIECAKHRTKSFWIENIKRSYQDAMTDHPITNQFKFFTIWPANVYFYVDNNEVKKEVTTVKSKILDDTFVADPDRMILLSVYNKSNMIVIRYAHTEREILA